MLYEVEEVYTKEQQVQDESYQWEELRDNLDHLLCCVDDCRSRCSRETPAVATSEYDKLESMLWNVQDCIEGRIEELRPGYCEGAYRGRFSGHKGMMHYALQEGINYVGLREVYYNDLRCKDAIEYISERGLSSMNYEATCQAVGEFRHKEFEQELSALMSRKGA